MRQMFRVLLLAASFSFVAHAEKANVVFVHGANVSEQEGQVWAKEMFKRLWQAGANKYGIPSRRLGVGHWAVVQLSPDDTNLEDARAW